MGMANVPGPRTDLIAGRLGKIKVVRMPSSEAGSCSFCSADKTFADDVYRVQGGRMETRFCRECFAAIQAYRD